MLYIFRVDTGTMMQFDMSLALESVDSLKQHIEKHCKVPASSQVLLVSGGQCLEKSARVCSFSAGTDTNPIFLFTKSIQETNTPPQASTEYSNEFDLTEKVREAQDLPASYSTVVQRANLAQQFYELAREQTRVCENLVHDQHLQQQGWAAVIANLEDLSSDFKRRSERYRKTYEDFHNDYDSYLNFLQSFYQDLEILEKIPVLPVLLPEYSGEEIPEESSENTDTASEPNKLTLLQWIKASDKKSTMDGLFEHCAKGLEQFNKTILNELKLDMERTAVHAENNEMKEVKGLGDRLYGLEQLMLEAKRYVQEQCDLAQSFLQNQKRAGNLGDTSILPDLCASHRRQLLVMLQNHQQLCDIRRRCTRAKEELSTNLFHRLKWVMYIESVMLDTDHRLNNCHENIQVIRRQLEILRQIHVCPATYLSAVAEVVRRRAFSQAFLLWASELACHLLTIHNEEVTRRKDFQANFEGHFLNSLFPGMEDLPPSYATQAPSIFDTSLPRLTIEDVERLKLEVPELQEFLRVPDLTLLTNFFLNKSIVKSDIDKVDDRGVEEKLVQIVEEVGLGSNLDQNFLKPNDSETCLTVHLLPHLKDLDRGCESETDTEEFEKVCQSPLDLHYDKDIPSPRPGTQDASTLTEDNLQTSRTEHDRLKGLLTNMAILSRQTIQQLKTELDQMKSLFISEKSNLELQYESLSNSWENLTVERDNKEKAIIQRLTYDHQSELQDFKNLAEQRSEEIKNLQLENICLEQGVKLASEENIHLKEQLKKFEKEIEESNLRIDELTSRLESFEKEKEKSLKDITDRLNREHRAEMENIRARYRFMTMERSPSESSLEKVDRQDKDRESLIRQIREACDKEKDEALKDTLSKESIRWQNILDQKLNELKSRYQFDRDSLIDEVTKRITEDKDKQIEMLRERLSNLSLENIKFRNTIQQLTESEVGQDTNELLEKVELLEREKCQLEAELSMERSRRLEEMPNDMSASVAVYEGRVDAATSPIRHKERLTKSQASLIKSGHLSIETCRAGDSVLVIWNPTYENYTILQQSSSLYFLHADCIEPLGLKKVNNEERKMYCTGEVYDKEYCHARKPENRYKVRKGTKFYRVKVRPLTINRDTSRSIQQCSNIMSQSQTTGPTIAENLLAEVSASHSLPSTPTKSQSQVTTKFSTKVCKPDTETLVMQSSQLMNQSASLLRELQRNIAVSTIDSSEITQSSSPIVEHESEMLIDMQDVTSSAIEEISTSTHSQTLETSAIIEVQEDLPDPLQVTDVDSLNKSESASNR